MWPYLLWGRPRATVGGSCSAHSTQDRVIQSMTLDSVWSHLLTLNWLSSCQTGWGLCGKKEGRTERRADPARLCSEEGGVRGRSVHRQHGDGRRLIITQHTTEVSCFLQPTVPLPYRTQPHIVRTHQGGEGRLWSALINMVLTQT